jgi:translocator protein
MKLVICIAACIVSGVLGSLWTAPKLQPWYANLAKPAWTPPNWLFGPVWSALYLMMAIAAWLVWRTANGFTLPLKLFVFQLLLNVAWSGIFFGLRSPAAGLIDIALLWLSILATAIAFWQAVPVAGWLLLPYLIWVGYASALNFSIWRLNS